MFFTEKTHKAIEKAAALHIHQHRKGSDKLPYIIHPMAVALILSQYTGDEDIIIAALMHDTIEDTPYVSAELEREFGTRVAELVHGVTEAKFEHRHTLTWQERKASMLTILKEADTDILMIRAADNMHNLLCLMSLYDTEGKKALSEFHTSVDNKLQYDKGVLEILHERLDSPIVEEYQKVYEKAVETFGLNMS